MGPYLSAPIRTKHSLHQENKILKFACTSMQGWRNSMEDAHISELNFDDQKECSIFGIFDGHGGKEAAIFVGRHFVKTLKQNENFKQKNMELALKETFMNMDELMKTPDGQLEMLEIKRDGSATHIDEIKAERSNAGCTANVVLIYKNIIYVANCGDSRSVICKQGVPVEMSIDHKPQQPGEKNRVYQAGGYIKDGRINGNLNLSRSLGDFEMKSNNKLPDDKQLVIAVPDIRKKIIQDDDEFLLMGCDGIWECMTNLQLITYIREKINHHPKEVLNHHLENLLDIILAPNTSQLFGCDNMSTILIKFKH